MRSGRERVAQLFDARRTDGPLVSLGVHVRSDNRERAPVLKALCGPGDYGEPVITVMLPEKD